MKLVGGACGALALLCGSAPAHAQRAQENAKVEAVILRPFTIVKTEDLLFGNVIPSATAAGTVTVEPKANATATHATVTGAGGTVSAARVIGLGRPGSIVQVRWPTAFQLTGPNGATMDVTNVRINNCVFICLGGRDPRIVQRDGFIEVYLGATLQVKRAQAEGDYEGRFTITIDYP